MFNRSMSSSSSNSGAGNIVNREEQDIPYYVQESFDNWPIDQDNNGLH